MWIQMFMKMFVYNQLVDTDNNFEWFLYLRQDGGSFTCIILNKESCQENSITFTLQVSKNQAQIG